ncbi:MAG: hypothetical protein EP298_00160 [Gammaproteobacteria bacterium]|nr:MAG: hypothetical protein EP298_00160 [Gammaproteobacteria bacterium]UTW43155.1 hypothetical protein KFE69_03140 [bacterium SCSIO 12844]
MDIEEELQQKRAELESIRSSISKLLSNGGVASYAAGGSTVGYRNLPELRAEERKILAAIDSLERIKSGKQQSNFITSSFKVM